MRLDRVQMTVLMLESAKEKVEPIPPYLPLRNVLMTIGTYSENLKAELAVTLELLMKQEVYYTPERPLDEIACELVEVFNCCHKHPTALEARLILDRKCVKYRRISAADLMNFILSCGYEFEDIFRVCMATEVAKRFTEVNRLPRLPAYSVIYKVAEETPLDRGFGASAYAAFIRNCL